VNGFTVSQSTPAITPITFAAPRSGIFTSLNSQQTNGSALLPNYIASTTAIKLQPAAAGSTMFWAAGGDGDWDIPGNWSTGALPGTSDVPYVPSGPTVTMSQGNADRVAGLIVDG